MSQSESPEQKEAAQVFETIGLDLLTTPGIADRLGVTVPTIENWRKAGCPYVRIKGAERDAIRFRYADVRAWALAQGKQVPPESEDQAAAPSQGPAA